ncbi:hypothetical protein EEW87_17720 (plasmid) [Janibacter melonis]|uniref:Uncharacterized protein n=1 Tax=Janibacter melonis TaxID=262209 RepID=A0A650GFX2_9MICO|nr:hypothetical protein [Janibacter melonis]QGX08844.1 hypothetical protein EEW87_17720 [Janibacter melonis]
MSTPGLNRPAPASPATLGALTRRPARDLLIELGEYVVFVAMALLMISQRDLQDAWGGVDGPGVFVTPLALLTAAILITVTSIAGRRIRTTEPVQPAPLEVFALSAVTFVFIALLGAQLLRDGHLSWQLYVPAMLATAASGIALKVLSWRRPLPRTDSHHYPILDDDGPARVLAALAGVRSYRASGLQDRLDVDQPTLIAWHQRLVDAGYATSHLRGTQPWLNATDLGRTAIAEHLAAITTRS